MQFQFEGQTYRLGFRHEVSRRWEDHCGDDHQTTLQRVTYMVQTKKGPKPKAGPAMLICLGCTERLGMVVRLSHLSKAEKERRTWCSIRKWEAEGHPDGRWAVVYERVGRVNRKAGDRYEKEAGRIAALRNALASARPASIQFNRAAWKAYNERGKASSKEAKSQ